MEQEEGKMEEKELKKELKARNLESSIVPVKQKCEADME